MSSRALECGNNFEPCSYSDHESQWNCRVWPEVRGSRNCLGITVPTETAYKGWKLLNLLSQWIFSKGSLSLGQNIRHSTAHTKITELIEKIYQITNSKMPVGQAAFSLGFLFSWEALTSCLPSFTIPAQHTKHLQCFPSSSFLSQIPGTLEGMAL